MKYRLLTPGPVPLTENVLRALARPVIHHRTPEFEEILARVLNRLKSVFLTSEPVFIHPSTGTGGMESAVVNTLSPGDKVICICAGKFGERWADICETYGMQTIRLNVPWGEDLKLDQLQELLRIHPNTQAILTQACETSSGAWLPVHTLAQLVRQQEVALKHPIILMVDAITALGAAPLPMDEWGLDVVVAGSQKALMLPTGLSFVSFSKKAWKFVEQSRSPRYYWDLRPELAANRKNQTRFSSAVSLIAALDAALDFILKTGLSTIHEQTAKRALATRNALKILDLQLFPKTPSPSLTCVVLPGGINGEAFRETLETRFNMTVMGGQDHLKGKVLRIGHMGAIEDEDVIASIQAIGDTMTVFAPGAVSDSQIHAAIESATEILQQNL